MSFSYPNFNGPATWYNKFGFKFKGKRVGFNLKEFDFKWKKIENF